MAVCLPLRMNTPGDRNIRSFVEKTSETEIRERLPDLFPRLWRYAFVVTGNRDLASELAQKTCLKALEKASGYQVNTDLDRWLFRIAQRLWLNDLRAQAVRRGNGLLPVEEIEHPDAGSDAETNYFVREVLSFVGELPEAQRTTVLLVYVEGFKYAEAADILGVPVGTIMSRLAAARKTLNARIKNGDRDVS